MANNISSNYYKINNLAKTLNGLAANTDVYYLFIGDYDNHSNAEIQPIYDNPENLLYNAYNKMILGKQVLGSDIALGIRYIPWVTNTIFDMYDHEENDLKDKDFFCVTSEGSYHHVWKCLDNNNDAASTVKPLFSHISGSNTNLYQTSDGYRWKYMATVANTTVDKFKVGTEYFPIVANATVSNAAIDGSIHIIKVEEQGRLYNNFIVGNFTTNDIRVNGVGELYKISNSEVNSTNGFYTGCLIYITTGNTAGEFRTITDYVSNSTGALITLDSEFDVTPVNGDAFEIMPKINILGDGTQTTNAVARGLVNTLNSNSIYRIEVLENGAGYKSATANVIANTVVGVSNTATIRPILPPYGGHGYFASNELYCNNLILSVRLSNTESSTIPSTNQFQQFGILCNPIFNDVVLNLSYVSGTFDANERILKIDTKLLNGYTSVTEGNNIIKASNSAITGTVSVNTTSSNVIGTGTSFVTQFSVNGFVYVSTSNTGASQLGRINSITNSTHLVLKANCSFVNTAAYLYPAQFRNVNFRSQCIPGDRVYITTDNFELNQLMTVNTVVNATSMEMTTNALFSCSECYAYSANVTGQCYHANTNAANSILVTNCGFSVTQDSFIIGETSGTVGIISSISRAGVEKNYSTFVQMYKYIATSINGTFEEGETITQGTSNGTLHSVEGSGTLTLYSNKNFSTGQIVGSTSGAVANVTQIYEPELIFGSGQVSYLRNVAPVERAINQNEQFQIVFNF